MIDYAKQNKVDKTLPVDIRVGYLRYCASLYETNGTSPIADKDYDEEYYDLQKLDPDNSFFDEVGGEIDKDNSYGEILPHKIKMGSLSKCLNVYPDFEGWVNSTFSNVNSPKFLFQHKIDGLSLSLVYSQGKLIQALTRGDGDKGVNVLQNVAFIKDIPQTISCKDEVEIRGEVYKDRASFKVWKDLGYSNERAFASGSLNQKDPTETGRRELSFIAYEVLRIDFSFQQEKADFLEKLGFKTLKSTTRLSKSGNTLDQIVKAAKYYMDSIDRNNLPYLIDGIVVKLCDIKKAKSMGSTSNNTKPKSDKAIKYPSKTAETTIIGIETNVGRTGKLCPVGILKSVEIEGCNITRVTLHNFGSLVGKDAIKIGARVIIARKSDIIPQIVSIVENKGTEFQIPSVCPSCGHSVSWTESNGIKVDLICTNDNCIAQLNKKIENFFVTMGVKGFGKGTIAKLTDKDFMQWGGEPIISCLSDMYWKLDNDRRPTVEHPFQKYAMIKQTIGEKTYENLIESIKSVKEVSLPVFTESLGIGRIGSMSKDICAIAPTIEDIDKLTVSDLLGITGFAETKAKSFIDGWKAQRKEVEILLKYITIKKDVKASDKLNGKKFCFTGSFSKPRDEMRKIAEDNGGKTSSSVGSGVILVWDGEEQGNKLKTAQEKKNQIISEEEFFNMLK